MSKPVLIPMPSLAIGLDVIAVIRHGAMRDLKDALTNGEQVPDAVVETIQMMDAVGAAWANRTRPDVSSDLSSLAPQSFVPVEWVSVSTAAKRLHRTPQAVTGLLSRGSLHGEKADRVWRVCSESVIARQEGSKCQH